MWSDPWTSQRKVIGNNNNDGVYFERDNTRVHNQYMCLDEVVKGKNYNRWLLGGQSSNRIEANVVFHSQSLDMSDAPLTQSFTGVYRNVLAFMHFDK